MQEISLASTEFMFRKANALEFRVYIYTLDAPLFDYNSLNSFTYIQNKIFSFLVILTNGKYKIHRQTIYIANKMNTLLKVTKPLVFLILLLSFNVLMQHANCRVQKQSLVEHTSMKVQKEAKVLSQNKVTKGPSPPSGSNHNCYTPSCARK